MRVGYEERGEGKMELHQIDNFIAAATHQHFTNAAKERMISQLGIKPIDYQARRRIRRAVILQRDKSRPADKAWRAVLNKSKTSETSFK